MPSHNNLIINKAVILKYAYLIDGGLEVVAKTWNFILIRDLQTLVDIVQSSALFWEQSLLL